MDIIAGSHGFHHSTCPQPAICGQEAVIWRQLGLQVPCVHEVLAKGWPVQIGPRPFDLCNTGHPDIVAQEFPGQWEFPEPHQKRAAPAQPDEIETAALGVDILDERTVDRILLE
jgi:hypothetical protein